MEESPGSEKHIAHLTSVILNEIPDQKTLLALEVPDPQPEVVPVNFNGILDIKEDLKHQRVRIPRAEGWDKDGNKTGKDVRQEYRDIRKVRENDGFDNKAHILAKRDDPTTYASANGSVFITKDEFPYHVDQSGDAEHLDVWVDGQIGLVISPATVANTIARYLYAQGLGEHDFVLIQNPPANKTLPEVEHLHLLRRVKHP